MRSPATILMTLACSLAVSSPVLADLIVGFGDLSLTPGQAGTLDVTVRSDDPAGDLLDLFTLEMEITTDSANRLEFFTVQSGPQLTDPDYVFSGVPSFDSPLATVGPPGLNTSYVGGDGTLTGSGAFLEFDRVYLLTRLELTAWTMLPPVIGDLYRVSLVDGATTGFLDPDFNPISYQTGFGVVRIVPAPPSGLLAIGGMLLVAQRRRLCA